MTLLNRSLEPVDVVFDFASEDVVDRDFGHEARFSTVTYNIRDLWEKVDRGTTAEPLTATVPGHDVLMVRLTGR